MAELKYPVIKSREQYNLYCNTLEGLLTKPKQTRQEEEEVELLTALINLWDQQHSQVKQLDPVQLLRSFIKEHELKPSQAMEIMGIGSRGHFYEVVNYKKGLSKEVIRNLAAHFKVSQEAFNRSYPLKKPMARAATRPATTVKPKAKEKIATVKSKPNRGEKPISKKRMPTVL